MSVKDESYEGWLRTLAVDNERLRAALTTLECWDMLSLDAEGHGAATADAPWARALIADALHPEPTATERAQP